MPLWWREPTSDHAYKLSLVSIIITLFAAIVGIVGYAQLDDSLILIYGLENIVDFFSSAIVLWRFNRNPLKDNIDEEQQTQQEQNELLSKREKRASIGVSIVLAILGFGGLITAIEDLSKGKGYVDESHHMTIFYIAFVSFVVFGVLAKFKFHYANELSSPSLRKDGLCSALGAILSFSMSFNSLLSMASKGQFWWWLDPTVAFICGLGALGYGLYGMYKAYVKDGYPIFNCMWWLYGGESRNSDSIEGQGAQQEIGGGGELELQQQQEEQQRQQLGSNQVSGVSSQGHPSSTSQSGTAVKTKSDNEMSDVVFT